MESFRTRRNIRHEEPCTAFHAYRPAKLIIEEDEIQDWFGQVGVERRERFTESEKVCRNKLIDPFKSIVEIESFVVVASVVQIQIMSVSSESCSEGNG